MESLRPPGAPVRDPAREALLRAAIGPALRGEVQVYREVGSTMDLAHGLAAAGAPEGTLVVADQQTAGRGRLGRVWESPAGGLYLSLLVRPSRPAAETPQLSLVAGLALAEAIAETTGHHATIRWPNDVLLERQKVAGILTEGRDGAIVMGMGVNLTSDPARLPPGATSLHRLGDPPDADRLTGAVYRTLLRWYDIWRQEGFGAVRGPLRHWVGIFGTVVSLDTPFEQVHGTAADIDDAGRLLVRLDSGVVRAFDVGEVSLLR